MHEHLFSYILCVRYSQYDIATGKRLNNMHTIIVILIYFDRNFIILTKKCTGKSKFGCHVMKLACWLTKLNRFMPKYIILE